MELTQQSIDKLLSTTCTPERSELEMLKEQNAVLLNVIKDYQHMLYHQSNYIAQLVSDGQEIIKGVIH